MYYESSKQRIKARVRTSTEKAEVGVPHCVGQQSRPPDAGGQRGTAALAATVDEILWYEYGLAVAVVPTPYSLNYITARTLY